MASTPDTSFSSSAETPRGRARKRVGHAPDLPSLPSPRLSDSDVDGLTDAAYHAIWDHFCGLPPADYSITFNLRDQAIFERLYKRLDRQPGLSSHFEEEIWKEWDADTGVLLLRLMPIAKPIHEVSKMKINKAINAELDRIAHKIPVLRPLREKIILAGHSSIKKKTKRSQAPEFWKVPGGQTHFASQGCRYPPFIVEVAYSQDKKELRNTIMKYFKKFPGQICTILSIKIQWADEEKRKLADHFHAASISLWTSELSESNDVLIRHILDAAKFRNHKGHAMPGAIVIPLALFLPLKERDKHDIPRHAELRLDFADLASYVEMGEACQRKRDNTISRSLTPPSEHSVKVLFADVAGDVVEEHYMPSKRQRTGSIPATSRPRTRSQSQPRRSSRIESHRRSFVDE